MCAAWRATGELVLKRAVAKSAGRARDATQGRRILCVSCFLRSVDWWRKSEALNAKLGQELEAEAPSALQVRGIGAARIEVGTAYN